jgi:hypothetical protein
MGSRSAAAVLLLALRWLRAPCLAVSTPPARRRSGGGLGSSALPVTATVVPVGRRSRPRRGSTGALVGPREARARPAPELGVGFAAAVRPPPGRGRRVLGAGSLAASMRGASGDVKRVGVSPGARDCRCATPASTGSSPRPTIRRRGAPDPRDPGLRPASARRNPAGRGGGHGRLEPEPTKLPRGGSDSIRPRLEDHAPGVCRS